jgi:hypothetical protein
LDVSGGRTTTLDISGGQAVAWVDLLGQPDRGHASVNPDGTIVLVLSDDHTYTGPLSLDYRVTFENGSQTSDTLDLNVTPVTQAKGWGVGEHYMLEEDANGDIVVEHGDNHQKVYVSESQEALTRAKIAALEKMAVEDVTTRWIRDNSTYGQHENTALATALGVEVWQDLTGPKNAPGSHWLLFEKGYEYSDLGRFMVKESAGESALHPLHITSWGETGEAVLETAILLTQTGYDNVVVSDLRMENSINVYNSKNILVTDTEVFGATNTGINVRNTDSFTLHDSSVSYAVAKGNDGEFWTEWNSGMLVTGSDHAFVTGNLFHHNGWEKDYNINNTIDGGVAPNTYKHNVYFQWNTSDVTFTDNISTQSSSFGVKLRGGAFAEENFLADNNVGADMLGGDYKGRGQVGNFTFFADNVITNAGYKIAPRDGAHSWGIQNKGFETALLDNIVMHLADPDDPADLAAKPITQFALDNSQGSTSFDNTKIFNWKGADPDRWKGNAQDQNLGDADPDVLMQTTIQRYAELLTGGRETTIDGLSDYLLSLANTAYDDAITARDINEYFQNAFGLTLEGPDADSHRFIPNDIASGMRWDNRVNWDNGEVPGARDSVDLGGNHVYYGAQTVSLGALSLGKNGHLSVNGGKLTVDTALAADTGSEVDISGAGQFWTSGYGGNAALDLTVAGGRFANTGRFDGPAILEISGDAQAILATSGASMKLDSQSALRIEGSDARVGFDGETSGPAVLWMEDQFLLQFAADAEGLSGLREFRSGHWDQKNSPVQSGVMMDGVLEIDLSQYAGGPDSFELIDVDVLAGAFDDISVRGLGSGFDARVVVDHDSDALMLDLSLGQGRVFVETTGDPLVAPEEDIFAIL